MRILKFVVINFILVFALTICVGISKVEAFTYLGEFRWEESLDGFPAEKAIIRLGVTDMGDGHFILSGRDEGCDCVIHGSGEVIGTNVIFTLQTARNNEGLSGTALETQTYHVTLSLSSLDGTYKRYYTCCGEDTNVIGTTIYESGTWTFLGP